MKTCEEIKLLPYKRVYNWIRQMSANGEPVSIPKTRKQSPPFRAWAFGNCLLLMANENARTKSQYILTKDQWTAFTNFVKDHRKMTLAELGTMENIRKCKCTNKTYWPAIMHICNAYIAYKNN